MATVDGLTYDNELGEFLPGGSIRLMHTVSRMGGLVGGRSGRIEAAKLDLAKDRLNGPFHEQLACEWISQSAAQMAADDGLSAFNSMVEALDVLELMQSRVGVTARALVIAAALRYNMAVHSLRVGNADLASTLVGEMLAYLRASAATESVTGLFKSVLDPAKKLVDSNYANHPAFARELLAIG